MESEQGEFLGELRPHWGRWHWPLRDMKPGEYFIVGHELKPSEDVRNYVGVRGVQLCKSFSVAANDPEHPGFTRVTCVPFGRDADNNPAPVLKFESAAAKLMNWFAVDPDEAGVWKLEADHREVKVKALMVDPQAAERLVFSYGRSTIGMSRKGDELTFVRLPQGWTLKVWEKLEHKREQFLPPLPNEEDHVLEFLAARQRAPIEELRMPMARDELKEIKEQGGYGELLKEMGLEPDPLADIMC